VWQAVIHDSTWSCYLCGNHVQQILCSMRKSTTISGAVPSKPWLRTIDEICEASIAMITLIPHDTALTSLQVLRAITGDYFLCNIDTYRLELPQGYQICDKNSQHKRADTFTAHKGARIPCVDPGCFGAQMVHLVLEQLISLVRSCEIGVKDCLWSKHTAVVRLVIIEVHFVVEV